MQDHDCILQMQDIKKEFSGVYALSGISFSLHKGEILCLVGENGAGKSTLMKVLSGAYTPSSGTIVFEGKSYTTLDPHSAQELGISIVYQENDLVQSMSVTENIFIGNEIAKNKIFIDKKAMHQKVQELVDKLDLDINIRTKIEDLKVSDQQFVKILKALMTKPKVLIMDEPTSMFNVEDAKKVTDLAQRIAKSGIGIIYISHFLNEVIAIADKITVIRDGRVIKTYDNENKDTKVTSLTSDMVGRSLDMFYTKEHVAIGDVKLKVKDLQLTEGGKKISFDLHKGEILGFAGMVGAGRTEIIRALTGADSKFSGKVFIDGKEVEIKNPADGIKAGFAHITEDRQRLGLMLKISVLENALVVGLDKIKGFFFNLKKTPRLIEPIFKALSLKTPSVYTEAVYLSGGNQQKVVLAKWLFANKDIYVFDEPTRGIDVNAKAEFYQEMTKLCKQGKSIIMISSDMPELISMSDRVLVIRDGGIDCELTGSDINEKEIIKRALGVSK